MEDKMYDASTKSCSSFRITLQAICILTIDLFNHKLLFFTYKWRMQLQILLLALDKPHKILVAKEMT
jgi:hypothetical protein